MRHDTPSDDRVSILERKKKTKTKNKKQKEKKKKNSTMKKGLSICGAIIAAF